jgi:glycosyltransferase involved in cell wall biosynthesis
MEYYEENPDRVKQADMVVGIPSYQEADLISYPTTQAGLGLKQYFPNEKAVIINCDNDSQDGTKEAFLNTDTGVPKIYLSTPEGVKGKGNNLKNLFRKVVELDAQACVVVDADLTSITPKWIKNLGEPLLKEFGFVAPLYVRHKYDGTITNNIAYPLIRSVFGRRVRQPIGGDFGFSAELARIFLDDRGWDERVANFGIDIWMTTIAICHNIPICQSFMGRPKIHKPKDPAADLGPMFSQVVGTMFGMMAEYEKTWKSIRWSKPSAIFGFGLGDVEMPPPVNVDKTELFKKFGRDIGTYEELWGEIIDPENYAKLKEVLEMDRNLFDFPSHLWSKILFDYAIAYREGEEEHEKILQSLIPLYYGKTYSFVLKTEDMSTQQAEEYIEDQCMVFEETRPYLDEKWGES